MAKRHITATVNGDPVEFLCEPHETLLDVLRDQLGLTGTKEGCSTGDCGSTGGTGTGEPSAARNVLRTLRTSRAAPSAVGVTT